MLNPRLTDCTDCVTVSNLLKDIDCKLTVLGKKEYNNTVLLLNRSINETVYSDLLNYKRILTYRSVNPDYVECVTLDKIASKVKILINK